MHKIRYFIIKPKNNLLHFKNYRLKRHVIRLLAQIPVQFSVPNIIFLSVSYGPASFLFFYLSTFLRLLFFFLITIATSLIKLEDCIYIDWI